MSINLGKTNTLQYKNNLNDLEGLKVTRVDVDRKLF